MIPTLWSSVEALDIIKLDENEGSDFQGPFNILFPESKDARDAILSVANLQETFQGPLNVVMSEMNEVIVIRNMIILLIFYFEEDPAKAAEYALHAWYSLLITEPCYELLKKIGSVLQGVYDEIRREAGDDFALATKRLRYCKGSIDITLPRIWFRSLFLFTSLHGFKYTMLRSNFQSLRRKVLSTPVATEFFESTLVPLEPYRRVSETKFREDGMLLPFGQSREDFVVPNPLLTNSSVCVMADIFSSCWPLSGWSNKSFHGYSPGPPENDQYGKLNHYLRGIFIQFHRRIRSIPVNVSIFGTDQWTLAPSLEEGRFNRIYSIHFASSRCTDNHSQLKPIAPLLQPASVNRHATFITLTFYTSDGAVIDDKGIHNITSIKGGEASFNKFLEEFKVKKLADDIGLYIKNRNTILETWRNAIGDAAGANKSNNTEDQRIHFKFVEWRTARDKVEESSV
ncbi:hypothetical protein F5B19DRAFT_500400 [Rostrohypoxylon terebratum]|nr:hypothetical protein F5B19DRAFT_500400 [Rostrohypoxylon terebratum]